MESALESVLLADGNLREQLVFKYGFSIHRVQPSKDRRTVFILWDASPGKAQVPTFPARVYSACALL